MTNLLQLTTSQLHQILAIKEKIEALQGQIGAIAAGGDDGAIPFASEAPAPAKRKYHMSPAHRRKLIKALAKARKIRWAKLQGKAMKGTSRLIAAGRAIIAAGKATPKAAKKKDRRSSPAVRAKLAAAAKARWAKVRAEGKTTL